MINFFKQKIVSLYKCKNLISFQLDLNKASKAIIADLKKGKPKLVKYINGIKIKILC